MEKTREEVQYRSKMEKKLRKIGAEDTQISTKKLFPILISTLFIAIFLIGIV
jgi:hypothetical protein